VNLLLLITILAVALEAAVILVLALHIREINGRD
jgi:hypothetical protein